MVRHYATVERVCIECGAPFQAVASEVRRGHGVLCGIVCRNRRAAHRRGDQLRQSFMDRVQKSDNCWLWTGMTDKDGYGRLKITENGKKVPRRAHRVSWTMHHGPIPDGIEVLHQCDVPACVRPDHLFLGTNLENIADRQAKERQSRGERCSLTKYSAELVRTIRSEYVPRKMSYPKLAKKHGLSMSTVRKMIRRETWKHLDP